jgi:predicted DNA-binding antitoxin AbrB/MazE fold protein
MMSSGIIPAIYEGGIFRPLERPAGLAEHQQVQIYFVIDEMWISEPLPLEENLHFVRETMGAWQVEDQEFRRWLAEDASLFDE